MANALPNNAAREGSRGWRAKRPRTITRSRLLSEGDAVWSFIIEILLVLLVLCLFVPEAIAINLGAIKLTPAFAVSILLFPLLVLAGRLRWVWPDLLVLGLFVSMFLSISLSVPLSRSVESIGRIILISVVPYFAGRFLMQDIARLRRIFGLLATIACLLALLSVLESFSRFNVHSWLWGIPYWPHHEMRLGLTRAHGWTTHSIMFGLVNAVFIPIIVVSAKERLRVVGRWQWFKLGAVSVGCFMSLSTGAWMPAAASLLFVAWDYFAPFKTKHLWPITFVTVALTWTILDFASGRPLLRIIMMELHLTSPMAWYYRWRLYERVFEVMPGHWWFGHGLDTPHQFRGFQRSIDNNYLFMLMTYGRIGLFMWITVAFAVIFYGGKAVWMRQKTRMVRLTRAFCFSLLGIILTQLSVALFSTPGSLYWMMMGLIIGGTLQCRTEQARLESTRSRVSRSMQQGQLRAETPVAASLPDEPLAAN